MIACPNMEEFQFKTLISAGFLFLGLSTLAASSLAFRGSKNTVGNVTRKNMVPWSPSGFLGTGERSPVYGIMWGIIYTLAAGCIVGLIIAALGRAPVHEPERLMWASFSCFCCFLFSSLWELFYTRETPTGFVLASVILCLCAVVSGISSFLINPFADVRDSWAEDLCGVCFAFLFGWVLVATALSIGITTRVFNRGINANTIEEDETSWWPLALGILSIILSCVFFNGVIALPLLTASFFFRGFLKTWRVWIASVLAAVAAGVGVCLMLLDRYTF